VYLCLQAEAHQGLMDGLGVKFEVSKYQAYSLLGYDAM
jgi:hypothetical protein